MRDGGWEMGDVTGVSPGEEEGDWFEGVGWLGGLGRLWRLRIGSIFGRCLNCPH